MKSNLGVGEGMLSKTDRGDASFDYFHSCAVPNWLIQGFKFNFTLSTIPDHTKFHNFNYKAIQDNANNTDNTDNADSIDKPDSTELTDNRFAENSSNLESSDVPNVCGKK